jgi:hypothetical protein
MKTNMVLDLRRRVADGKNFREWMDGQIVGINGGWGDIGGTAG